MFRRGSLTSPAVNVMLFQASAENSEPTCATENATIRPSSPPAADTTGMKEKSGTIVAAARGAKAEAKLAATTSAFLPMRTPTTMSRASDSVFAEVKMFWMIFPILRPRVLIQVKSAIIRTPTSCWRDRLIAYPEEMSIGGTIHEVGETQGTSTPR